MGDYNKGNDDNAGRKNNAITVYETKANVVRDDHKTVATFNGPIPKFVNNTVLRDSNDVKDMKRVTAFSRKTLEYKRIMKYIKEKLTQKQGLWMSNLNGDMKGVKFEVHHSPFTLFDIVSAVTEHQIQTRGGVTDEFEVASEVMQLHYKGWIGLVTLTTTEHEATHADNAPIHGDNPLGNWSNFVLYYEQYFNMDTLDKHKRLLDSYSTSTPFDMPASLIPHEVHLSLPTLGGNMTPGAAQLLLGPGVAPVSTPNMNVSQPSMGYDIVGVFDPYYDNDDDGLGDTFCYDPDIDYYDFDE